MKVLIISGTGFIGSNLSECLSREHDVTIISKYKHKFRKEIQNVSYIYKDWRIFNFEIFFSNNQYDKIILLGWSDHPRSSNKKIFESFNTNVIANIKIIDKIFHYSKADIYFLSSFGALPQINSSYRNQLISGYSAGKLTIETYLETYSEIFERNTLSIRLSNPFGKYQDPYGSQGVIAVFIGNAIGKKQINIFQNEDFKKDYINITTASEIITNIIAEPQTNFFEIKEVRSGKVLSVLNIASHINFHIPIIDIVPEKFKELINQETKKLKVILEKNEDSDEKNFSNQVLSTINWIKK
tara:strand:- start:7837 stop:8730 length:894 start_codon:yes stop_codon:yes gene_type:complete